jgi:hypothetical protein
MKRRPLLFLLTLALTMRAGQHSGTIQSTKLYTQPDPSAKGGLRGKLDGKTQRLIGVFALNAMDFAKVYKATLDGDAFSFNGLPTSRYDLWVLLQNEFYEGSTLHRGPSSLTPKDREGIEKSVNRVVPFFDRKRIHRLEGEAGSSAKARAVLQEYRAGLTLKQDATVLEGRARSLKLVLLEDVGTGWIVADTREVVRIEDPPGDKTDFYAHHHNPGLGGIRVVDSVRDLGVVNLD